ncbi:MAG: 3-deoxy-D-manno-octulosonic acid transferase [Planctomycetes bacterium]|nr:3-deoxy-D-manno-octulosonic acid transferase [Planctomycetota bacterium]
MSLRASRWYLRLLQCVYDLFYAVLLLVGSPFVLLMMIASPRWRAGLRQRLGFVPEREGSRPAVWIHGVSVGEVLAAKALVDQIAREMPWLDVVLSTTTRTGHEAAVRTYPGRLVFYFPLDFSFVTSRVMSRIRPSLVLLMELELWPNFLLTTSLRDVPVLLANGRMTATSARDYRILQRVIPEPMTRVMHYCVQSEQYADRFRSLGVPSEHISVTGSMKFDSIPESPPPGVRAEYERRLCIDAGAFVLLAGSTHAGEEEVVLDAFAEIRRKDAGARVVLVPRHPERLDEVEALTRSRGLDVLRLSALVAGGPTAERRRAAVVLVDTMGELAALYSVADLVFVGGSLTKRGGQNMMEPAGLGRAVVVGPNTWNFRDPMELLRSRLAIAEVGDADAVCRTLVALHDDPERRRELARRAREVCMESKGATRRMLLIIQDRLRSTPGAPSEPDPPQAC